MDLFMQERIAPTSPTIMNLREVGVNYAMEKTWIGTADCQ
jgi:hypothetical protein